MSTTALPPLYAESSHGKQKVWSVDVEVRGAVSVIVTTHGYVGSKQVVAERAVTVGKNLGKSNATTPHTQAVSEATALWAKKKDAGYVERSSVSDSVSDSVVDGTDATAALPCYAPMLAHDWHKRGKSIVYPCFAQRKLDGVRCVAVVGVGLFSRNGKPMSAHLTHIAADVAGLPAGVVLDGELYSDDLSFQEVVGLVKKKTLVEGDAAKVSKIFLFVYDTIRAGTNAERNAFLTTLFAAHALPNLRLLDTDVCRGKDDVASLHATYVAEGYEGLILRNTAASYAAGQRSVGLQKYKEFEDAEYTVVGFKEGEGSETGCVIWICVTEEGKEFSVRPRGTREERTEAYGHATDRVGKALTVRFQELTDAGIPRFPVGIEFRDYE
jgi:ATP-dependent DNA ligase